MTRHDSATRRRFADMAAVVLAAAAFASSLWHVETVAERSGQSGVVGWLIALGTELVAIVGIMELRRGREDGYRPVAGWVCLGYGLVFSGAANLASGGDWFPSQAMAVAPLIDYLLVAVMLETRPGRSLGRRRRVASAPMVKSEPRPEPTPVQPERLHAVPEPRPVGQRAEIDESLFAAVLAGEMTQKDAAGQAGVSVRTFQRRIVPFTNSHSHAAVNS